MEMKRVCTPSIFGRLLAASTAPWAASLLINAATDNLVYKRPPGSGINNGRSREKYLSLGADLGYPSSSTPGTQLQPHTPIPLPRFLNSKLQ
jgi:hypothetical protein